MEGLGAAASAIQPADVALRIGRQIYTFLDELSKAGQNVRRLQDVFMELQGIIGDIQRYMIESEQQSLRHAAAPARSPVPTSLIRTVEWFAEDVSFLRRCLPDTLAPGMGAKIAFVLHKSKVEEAVRRLEERKATATLALSVIGRRNDTNVLGALKEVQMSLDTAATEQQRSALAASQLSAAQHCEVMFQTQIITAMLRSMTIPVAGASSVDASAQTRLVGKAVRAELGNLLEPVIQRFDQFDHKLDAVAAMLCQEVARQDLALESRDPSDKSPKPCMKCDHVPDASAIPDAAFGAGHPAPSRVASEAQVATLYTFTKTHSSQTAGRLTIEVTKYRTRGFASQCYYRVVIRYIPPRWCLAMAPRGVSLSYSTGPDQHGYFSLTPSIMQIHIVPSFLPRHPVFRNDDLPAFRRLLISGEFSLGCEDLEGNTLLKASIFSAASRIARFLLDTAPTAIYKERESTESTLKALVASAYLMHKRLKHDPPAGQHVQDHLENWHRFVRLCEPFHEEDPLWMVYAGGYLTTLIHLTCEIEPQPLKTAGFDFVFSLMKESVAQGFLMPPYSLLSWCDVIPFEIVRDSSAYLGCLELYLACSGDPNRFLHKVGPSDPVVENSLEMCIHGLSLLSDDPEGLEVSAEEVKVNAEEPPEWVQLNAVEMVVRLQSGADPYAIIDSGEGDGLPVTTLSTLAGWRGVEDIWQQALEIAGYSFDEVVATSNRRLRDYLGGRGQSSVVDSQETAGPAWVDTLNRRRPRVYEE